MAKALTNISAHIPKDLFNMLEGVAEFEERPKSYYVKKGLSEVLEEKYRDMQDYLSAKKTLEKAKKNDDFVSFNEVFKNVK